MDVCLCSVIVPTPPLSSHSAHPSTEPQQLGYQPLQHFAQDPASAASAARRAVHYIVASSDRVVSDGVMGKLGDAEVSIEGVSYLD